MLLFKTGDGSGKGEARNVGRPVDKRCCHGIWPCSPDNEWEGSLMGLRMVLCSNGCLFTDEQGKHVRPQFASNKVLFSRKCTVLFTYNGTVDPAAQ